jgi:hypothetical protein
MWHPFPSVPPASRLHRFWAGWNSSVPEEFQPFWFTIKVKAKEIEPAVSFPKGRKNRKGMLWKNGVVQNADGQVWAN